MSGAIIPIHRRTFGGSLASAALVGPTLAESARFAIRRLATARHATAYLDAGPADGPLMIFVHGWPELSLVWRAQIEHFAAAGFRCIAPDMRGYGGSSAPKATNAYAVQELVADLVDLHDALGAKPAVWVGHDWGSPVVAALVARQPHRGRGVVGAGSASRCAKPAPT
jgi:pimeloyl-ACP methyl ester carboxylesterase